ncbi:TetR/AcrR family transcriptional regulator [Roseibium alexandrii]|nr:TetR/AcrR family transcriptional regulator [Roseibium alexandrii]
MKQNKPIGRVSKQDWLEAALELFKHAGIDAVRVERLANSLGVSKSGFYYHFRDLADLQRALLRHWIELDHKPQKRVSDVPDLSAEEKLAIMADVVDQADLSACDKAIRDWAHRDPKVRRLWRAEMKERVDSVRALFAELGFAGDELEMRTLLFVGYHVSEREMFPDVKNTARANMRRLRLKFLLSR